LIVREKRDEREGKNNEDTKKGKETEIEVRCVMVGADEYANHAYKVAMYDLSREILRASSWVLETESESCVIKCLVILTRGYILQEGGGGYNG
jgi:hypothetical protein